MKGESRMKSKDQGKTDMGDPDRNSRMSHLDFDLPTLGDREGIHFLEVPNPLFWAMEDYVISFVLFRTPNSLVPKKEGKTTRMLLQRANENSDNGHETNVHIHVELENKAFQTSDFGLALCTQSTVRSYPGDRVRNRL